MIHEPDFDTSLPLITEKLLKIQGEIKKDPEYFKVTEIPSYEPLGYGNHIYVNLTKSLLTTRETQVKIAKILGLNKEDIGHAGLKDKYAITTQTFSIINKNNYDIKYLDKLLSEEIGVKINWINLHPKKLRTGHLRGNHFEIIITNLNESNENALKKVKKINELIKKIGIPNYYGPQRIGNQANNAIKGYEIISGKYFEKNRWLRRYLISSYLSHICNKYLSERIKRSIFHKLILGDIAKKHETGGVFWVDNLEIEQKRFECKEISFTAPIYGYKMMETKKDAKIFEEKIFSYTGITQEELRRLSIMGTRRIGRIIPEIKFKVVPEGIKMIFNLPAGAYATIVIREFMKNNIKFNSLDQNETEELK
ncbi:tRNA pseudouridine(13) synthase TruD [Candidatus Bathyarchaeota archaeon]|nr:tRNA pseudouridine(13) synthase TruD [Candidatus Bathyarchaeota archaeon]